LWPLQMVLATDWNGSIFPMQSIGKMPVARDSFKRSQKSLVSLEGELQDSGWKTGLKTTRWR
jgi:hypothetical protein